MTSRRTKPTLLAFMLLAAAAGAAGGGERLVSDLYRPGDAASWILELDGARIGEHGFRYEGTAELPGVRAHRFLATVSLEPLGGVPVGQLYAAELFTDDRGRLIRHVMQVQVGSMYSAVEITTLAGHDAVTMVQGEARRDVEVDVPAEAFIQANNFIGYFELMLGVDPPAAEGVAPYRLFSTNVLKVVPYTVRRTGGFDAGDEGFDETGAILEDSLGEVLHLTDTGRLARLSAPAQKLVVTRRAAPAAPVAITPPPPAWTAAGRFDAEEVTIAHGEVRLAGTITRPQGEAGPLPALFFISGSGAQDRNGRTDLVDVGTRELLDHLTASGFLVLRVDDRGAGASTGPTAGMGYLDLVADARACVEFLMGREDVDASRVALIGHSEGGITAPILAAELPGVAAIVLMAPSGRRLDAVMMEQNILALEQAGVTGAAQDEALAEIRRCFDLLLSDEPIAEGALPDEFAPLVRNRRWFQEHGRVDPIANIKEVRCPVLILHGEKDFQVSAERDSGPLDAALDEAGHPDHELVVFAGLDHLFKRTEAEQSTLADYFRERPLDVRFKAVLTEWLKKRLRSGAGG